VKVAGALAVVMGQVVVSVGRVHDPTQGALGAELAAELTMLPVKTTVPVLDTDLPRPGHRNPAASAHRT
jgi:hypothetical protein